MPRKRERRMEPLCNATIMLHYRKFQRRSNLGLRPQTAGVELATPLLEPAEFKRGPGGRPTRQEAERRHAVLLETAIRLFLEHGLDAVSVDEIAKQSAVAKRFIYGRSRDKSDLFVAAIEHAFADRLDVLHAFRLPQGRAALGLLAFGRTLLDIVLA